MVVLIIFRVCFQFWPQVDLVAVHLSVSQSVCLCIDFSTNSLHCALLGVRWNEVYISTWTSSLVNAQRFGNQGHWWMPGSCVVSNRATDECNQTPWWPSSFNYLSAYSAEAVQITETSSTKKLETAYNNQASDSMRPGSVQLAYNSLFICLTII